MRPGPTPFSRSRCVTSTRTSGRRGVNGRRHCCCRFRVEQAGDASHTVKLRNEAEVSLVTQLLFAKCDSCGVEVVAQFAGERGKVLDRDGGRLGEEAAGGVGEGIREYRVGGSPEARTDRIDGFGRKAAGTGRGEHLAQPWLGGRLVEASVVGDEGSDVDETVSHRRTRARDGLHERRGSAGAPFLGKAVVAEFAAGPMGDLGRERGCGALEEARRSSELALKIEQRVVGRP